MRLSNGTDMRSSHMSRSLNQWQGLPDSPELAQSEAVAKHPQQAWECRGRDLAQKMDRRSSGYGRSPALACWFSSSIEYLAHGSPPAWWFLGCVPFSSASGFTLVRLLAQSGTCTGPGRRTQRPAKMRTSPTRLLIDRELHLRVLGVQAPRGGGRPVRAFGT